MRTWDTIEVCRFLLEVHERGGFVTVGPGQSWAHALGQTGRLQVVFHLDGQVEYVEAGDALTRPQGQLPNDDPAAWRRWLFDGELPSP